MPFVELETNVSAAQLPRDLPARLSAAAAAILARGGDGEGRAGAGHGRLGGARRAALGLGGGRGGLGRAEPDAQRALRRVPGPRAGPGRRQDPHPLPPARTLAGGQEGDGDDLPVRGDRQ